MNIKYSIIIPCYRQSNALSQCLIALTKQAYINDFEIIVVHHEEDSLDDIRSNYPSVHWIYNSFDPNPYHSRNLGAKQAKGAYYCFIDVKCIPRFDWLTCLDSYINKHHDAKALAGQINVIPHSNKLKDAVHSLLYLNNKKNIERGYGVPAGHLIVKESVFKNSGGFSIVINSGNDIMYTKSLIQSGVAIHYVNDAVVDYQGFDYHQLKNKMKKYAKGVVAHGNSSVRQTLFGFLPMRWELFHHVLDYREMDGLSIMNKVRLWFLVWSVKIQFAINLMQAQQHRYFGASRDKG